MAKIRAGVQGEEQAGVFGALPGLPEHPGQHIAAIEGKRHAREAAAERLDRIEALRVLRRFKEQQRVGGEAGRQEGTPGASGGAEPSELGGGSGTPSGLDC